LRRETGSTRRELLSTGSAVLDKPSWMCYNSRVVEEIDPRFAGRI
jgi:hypothetical protein